MIIFGLMATTSLILAGHDATAAPVAIDTGDASNGLDDIFSVTFDGPLAACSGSSPSYCSFFGGAPGAGRSLALTPNPTGVMNGIPAGIVPTPASGSFLDLTLGANNSSVTLTGGTIRLPDFQIAIRGETFVTVSGAGFVLDAAPQVASVDADGRAEFLVNLAPSTAADFSTFTSVVTSCQGSLCPLIPILTLDMVRYRLFIDYDPSFTSPSADFIGQTANNSMVHANLSAVPLPAAGWLVGTAFGMTGLLMRRRRAEPRIN